MNTPVSGAEARAIIPQWGRLHDRQAGFRPDDKQDYDPHRDAKWRTRDAH